MNEVNSGVVVGCGSIGQRHIRNAIKLGVREIVGVDKDKKARKEANKVGATETYVGIADALSNHAPDFGIVAVPNHLHIPVAKKLIDAEIHLFIEKPLSHTTEGIAELIIEANNSNLITLVGCNLRFQPGIQKLRELLQDDMIGTPLSVQIEGGSYLPDWHPHEDYREMYSANPEMGGGAILDYIHELNYCRWLFGEIEEVMAMTSSQSHLGLAVEDIAELILKMENETLCGIHVDYIQRPSTRSCKIIGDEGTLRWELEQHSVKEYIPDKEYWKTHSLPDWNPNEMYVDELSHFFSCIEYGNKTICDIKEGYRDVQAALAALQSAEKEMHVKIDDT